ncbi:MAG: hypothetical protein AAEJ53_04055 [Myxococcota bacterium]
MRFKKSLILTAIAGVLGGCAFGASQVQLDYKLEPMDITQYRSKGTATIQIVEVKDGRGVDDPSVIVHKKNGYGQSTSGTYVAEKPIAEIVTGAVVEALEQLNYKISPDGKFKLSGRINSVDRKDFPGLLDDSIQLSLAIALQITTHGGDPVWSENFIGNGKVISSLAGGDVLREEFDDTLTRVVRQLQNSPTLYKALN